MIAAAILLSDWVETQDLSPLQFQPQQPLYKVALKKVVGRTPRTVGSSEVH